MEWKMCKILNRLKLKTINVTSRQVVSTFVVKQNRLLEIRVVLGVASKFGEKVAKLAKALQLSLISWSLK